MILVEEAYSNSTLHSHSYIHTSQRSSVMLASFSDLSVSPSVSMDQEQPPPPLLSRRKSRSGSFIGVLDTHHESEGVTLTPAHMQRGLHTVGVHPIALRPALLHVRLCSSGLSDISLLAKYPLLVSVDISDNAISDLSALAEIPALTTLYARKNNIATCLDYYPKKCSHNNAWAEGALSIGSMLTVADLAENNLTSICSLEQHPFLECLILSQNSIACMDGLATLKYLLVLDLSFNKLTEIAHLDGLNIQELSVEGNKLQDLSGLSGLPCLRRLNASCNLITSLEPLAFSPSLQHLNVSRNNIRRIRELEYVQELGNLVSVNLLENPCCSKPYYRLRCMHVLMHLITLDETNASPSEKLDALNLYRSEGGEAAGRVAAHESYLPDEPFEDSVPGFADDEESNMSLLQSKERGLHLS